MSSHALRLLCAAGILATLPLKIAVGAAGEPQDPEQLQARLSAFLAQHGFEVAPRSDRDGPFLRGVMRGCRIGVAEAVPQGWNRDALHQFSRGEERLFFVFDGRIHRDHPRGLTAIRHYETRLLRALMIDAPWRPSLAVTVSGLCQAETLPWGQLAKLD